MKTFLIIILDVVIANMCRALIDHNIMSFSIGMLIGIVVLIVSVFAIIYDGIRGN